MQKTNAIFQTDKNPLSKKNNTVRRQGPLYETLHGAQTRAICIDVVEHLSISTHSHAIFSLDRQACV